MSKNELEQDLPDDPDTISAIVIVDNIQDAIIRLDSLPTSYAQQVIDRLNHLTLISQRKYLHSQAQMFTEIAEVIEKTLEAR